MKAVKIILIIIIVLLGIVLIPPLFMPGELVVEKSRVMKAAPEVIWDQVNCLKNWENWDFWHQDPNIVGYYEGPECGVGAKNIWTMKDSTGGGMQTITVSEPYSLIKTELDFGEMGTADAEFRMEQVEEGTKVTWNFRSDSLYPLGRWFSTLLIKPGLETAYEQGLVNLDSLTMNMKPAPSWTTGEVTIEEVTGMAAIAMEVSVPPEKIADAMGSSFGRLMQYCGEQNVEIAGPPFSIWYEWEGDIMVFDCALPVSEPLKPVKGIKPITTYSGKVVTVEHHGPYETTQYSWEKLGKYIAENNMETNGDPWEVYITDPGQEPDPSKWVTKLYWPVK